jgi:hypothetical protein
MEAPAWLVHVLRHCWLVCPGCGPVTLSTRFCPVEEGDPDGAWDWAPVIHHAREDCPVLDDDAVRDDLGYGLLAEMGCHLLVADYGAKLPDHTAMAAP